MKTLYLLAETEAGQFAIAADQIETIVHAADVVPVPLADPEIAGLSALRSRVMTVIDMSAVVGGRTARVDIDQPLIVTELGGHLYGLAVSEVDDVVECGEGLSALDTDFGSGWARIAIGYVEIESQPIVVIDPARLVGGAQRDAA